MKNGPSQSWKSVSDDDQYRLVYFDTSIWMSYLFSEKHTFATCKKLIDGLPKSNDRLPKSNDRLPKSNDRLVIPIIVIIEVIESIRLRIPQISKSSLSSNQIAKIIDEKTIQFMKKIVYLNAAGRIVSHPHSDTSDSINLATLLALDRMPGTIISGKKQHRFKGPGSRDIEHAYHALQEHVSVLFTLDAGFEWIKKDKEFSRLRIRILRPGRGAGIA